MHLVFRGFLPSACPALLTLGTVLLCLQEAETAQLIHMSPLQGTWEVQTGESFQPRGSEPAWATQGGKPVPQVELTDWCVFTQRDTGDLETPLPLTQLPLPSQRGRCQLPKVTVPKPVCAAELVLITFLIIK